MTWNLSLTVGDREIALDRPVYFIADIASSHDGDLERAKDLIWKAKEAGADCAKFQHFLAKDIVSDAGFQALGGQIAHQADWSESVYAVFERYQTPRDWTDVLVATCAEAGIDYMTTPYDLAAVDAMAPHVPAFKIGSGDITWLELIRAVADHGKPVFLSTGAARMDEVKRAVDTVLQRNHQLCLMQCNTNYAGGDDNFAYVNLRVLTTYALRYPGMVLGLSDHTPGHAAVLGAVALGARAVEKHFTDDTARQGPDHGFSMDPTTWAEMVDRTRQLQAALGDGAKSVEANETESVVVQRRAVRATRKLSAGECLTENDLAVLRPCPEGALEPHCLDDLIGKTLRVSRADGEALMDGDVDWAERRDVAAA